jgi:predicted RNA-binding Zn-ribbon protein involved in translation (DUF1610 family)
MKNLNRKKKKKPSEMPLPIPPSPIRAIPNDEETDEPDNLGFVDMACPHCGEVENIIVQQTVTHWYSVDIIDSYGEYETGEEIDAEWHDGGEMMCNSCGHGLNPAEVWTASLQNWRDAQNT